MKSMLCTATSSYSVIPLNRLCSLDEKGNNIFSGCSLSKFRDDAWHILLPCSCCINTRTCNSTSVHDSARPLWPYTFVHELENDASTRAHLLACAHACETLCCGFLARKPEVSSLVWPARRASARLRTPLRGTNFESGSLARAFQRKHDYVHDAGALYTGYVHARFIHAVYRSVGADVCFMRACGGAEAAPAGAEFFIIFHQHG